MKNKLRVSVFMLAVFFLIGCSREGENVPVPVEQTTESSDREIMGAFNGIIESEEGDLVKLSAYLKDNIDKVSSENVDLMLQGYERAQMKDLPAYQDAFLVESIQTILLTYSIEDLRLNQVKEAPVLALLTEASEVGYKIEAIEGTVAPYVDYGYYAQFSSLATEPAGAFYKLMKIESDNPPQKDAALIIPWADVLQRGVDFEAYLNTYPGSFYEDRAQMHFDSYKNVAFIGSDNVPLFEYDTNRMNDEAKAAYTQFVDQGLKSEFATLIKTYLDLLETHDYIKTAEVESFISQNN